MRPANSATLVRLLGALLLLAATTGHAATVKLRLMRADVPDQRVSGAVTRIDVEAERARVAAEQRVLELAKGKGAAAPAAKPDELKPRAEFDRYCSYMRGIVVDGKFPFQRSYQGSYLGRSDEISLDLADGEHRVDPGHHTFTVANGQLTTRDPTLRVNGGALEILCYPVTIIAMDGSAVRQMPAEVLRLPVAPRLFWNAEPIMPKDDLVADGATFRRLTLYVLANTDGLGYRISPSERSFHVTPDGVRILDEKGQPATDRGVYTEGKFSIVLPKMSVPVFLRGQGLNVTIAGPAGSFTAETATGAEAKDLRRVFTAFSSRTGASLRFGRKAENGPVPVRGDFGEFPRRALLFDATAPGVEEPRYFAVSLPAGAVRAGSSLNVRIEAVDAMGAATITPFQPAAYLLSTPLLQADGSLLSNPDTATPDTLWRQLPVRAGAEPDVYRLEIPAELPSSVYYLRLVGDRRGHCTPRSRLQLDFAQGIVNPAAAATLSVFCPSGRRAFYRGADIPFSVVVKTTGDLPAAALRVSLKSDAGEFPLHEEAAPARKAGAHPSHFVLRGTASAALQAGRYTLSASLGSLAANRWPLLLVQPRDRTGTPAFDEGWLSPNFDVDMPYVNMPDSIGMANEKWARMLRQAGIRALRTDLQIVDWSGFSGGHPNYQGRDSASEIAQVEALLRGELALPASEVYYCQNNFEMVNEALAHYGLDHINSATCFLCPLSLPHSIPDQLDAKMRQYQLIAQIARKFENFAGLNPLFMNTSPLGNSEVPDPTRHERMLTMEKNFETQYGFKAPSVLEATEFIRALLKGQAPAAPEAGKRWEAYETMINRLMPDYYARIRTAVTPLNAGLLFPNRGPSWDGSSGGGTYPAVANANQEPLVVFTGHGDSGHDCIWEPYFRTMLTRTSSREVWGVDGAFYNCPMVKHNLAMYLAGGARGFGYLGGPKPEFGTAIRTEYARVAQDVLDVREFLRAYGPFLRRVRPVGDVAVFYPFTQSMYDDVCLERLDDLQTLNATLMQLATLGYSTEILTEERLAAGDAKRYRAVVAPLLFYLLPQYRQALEEYAAAGGLLLVGGKSIIVPKGAQKLANDFQEHAQARFLWSFQGPVDLATSFMLSEMRRKLPELKQALAPVVQPFAAPRSDTVFLQTATNGDARCTIVCNLLYPSFMGTTRLTPNQQVSGPIGEANENALVPQKVLLDVPGGFTTYDLLGLRALAPQPGANGRAGVECDLAQTPFRILLSLPEPIARLRVVAPTELVLGRTFTLGVVALGAKGQPLKVALPVEVRMTDGAGTALPVVYGVGAADETIALAADLGYRPGSWKLAVRELAGGRRVECTITVKAPEHLPFGDAVQAVPTVDVQDPELVRGFLDARRQDAKPVLILLDESQSATRTALAQELAQAFTALGIKSETKTVNAPGVFGDGERLRTFGGRFHEMNPEQFIPHPVALLGGEGENVLLEELQESRLFRRPLSAAYPGPGRGVLALVRSPFAYMADVLCVMGGDSDGIRAAIVQLKDIGTAAPGAARGPHGVPPAAAADDTKGMARGPRAPAATPGAVADIEGAVDAQGAFENREGAAVLSVTATPAGDRIAFGTSGYAKNVFVFDAAGKAVSEAQVGHIHASRLDFVRGGENLAVMAEGMSYLCGADGRPRWRLGTRSTWTGSGVTVDPAGRYLVFDENGRFTVFDLALQAKWGFDEWDKCETTRELLFGRKAEFLGMANEGREIAYRLTGKEPGAAGETLDVVVFADALTGRELNSARLDTAAAFGEAGIPPAAIIKSIEIIADGKALLVVMQPPRGKPPLPDLLIDRKLRLLRCEAFQVPAYFGLKPLREFRQVVWDQRQAFASGDTLCLSDPAWKELATLRTDQQIVSLAVDLPRRRLALSNLGGLVSVVDENLKTVFTTRLDSGARLAFLADGRLAVGTLRGQALLFAADGKRLWERSLNRFAPPADVERGWRELEALPGPAQGIRVPWWTRLQSQVDLGADQAHVAGSVHEGTPQTATFEGEPFATYLVEWRHGQAQGEVGLGLALVENEKAAADGSRATLQRLALTARPGEAMAAEYGVLKLGDRPDKIVLTVTASGPGQATSAVAVRPLLFPSKDLIRLDALYRGVNRDALYVNPPVRVQMFMNPAEEGAPHTSLRVMPEALVNGRLFEREPDLDKGLWWGGGAGAEHGLGHVAIPSWVELTLPQKRVLTHLVVAEDPSLPRAEGLTVDAYVESREVRQNVTAFEKRSVPLGFWHNVVKFRGNDSSYNVFRFPKPIYTNKIRVYVIAGHTSLTEIELYGALPKPVAAASGGQPSQPSQPSHPAAVPPAPAKSGPNSQVPPP